MAIGSESRMEGGKQENNIVCELDDKERNQEFYEW
jgi:hypothetical protein